jgi:hypothetical protein
MGEDIYRFESGAECAERFGVAVGDACAVNEQGGDTWTVFTRTPSGDGDFGCVNSAS